MGNKKNLPNIPLYIGDWEKDCNVLTLEAEAAWLRIIFKMFTKGKQSTYKIPTKGLQNLWRCSPEKMDEIIQEFIDYNICEVSMDGRFIEFTSRRFKKENEISEIRKEAVYSRKDRTKPKQKPYKTSTKRVQNTENDNDNENVIENKNEYFEKSEKLLNLDIDSETFVDIETLKELIKNEFTWRETICRNLREVIPKFSEEDFNGYLQQFFKQIANDGETVKTVHDTKKHFSRWLNIEIKKNGNRIDNNPKSDSDLKRSASDAVDKMFSGQQQY